MQTELNNLKDHLLRQLKFFANGYANVYLDDTAKKFTTPDTKESVSIQDNLGDYFYIRTLGDLNISTGSAIVPSRSKYVFKSENVLVAVMRDANREELLKCLINEVSSFKDCSQPLIINKAFLTNERVIDYEYPYLNREDKKKILARLGNKALVRLSFTMHEEFQTDNCECNPCIKCE